MTTLVSIIIIVFGVLQIILFFKIWAMTNDINAIRKKYTFSDSNVREYLLRGLPDDAYKALKDEIYMRMSYLMLYYHTEENFIKKATPEIEEYVRVAELAGFKLPDHMTSAEKYWKYQERLKGLK